MKALTYSTALRRYLEPHEWHYHRLRLDIEKGVQLDGDSVLNYANECIKAGIPREEIYAKVAELRALERREALREREFVVDNYPIEWGGSRGSLIPCPLHHRMIVWAPESRGVDEEWLPR